MYPYAIDCNYPNLKANLYIELTILVIDKFSYFSAGALLRGELEDSPLTDLIKDLRRAKPDKSLYLSGKT